MAGRRMLRHMTAIHLQVQLLRSRVLRGMVHKLLLMLLLKMT